MLGKFLPYMEKNVSLVCVAYGNLKEKPKLALIIMSTVFITSSRKQDQSLTPGCYCLHRDQYEKPSQSLAN